MLVSYHTTTWRHNPEDRAFNLRHCENLKSGSMTQVCLQLAVLNFQALLPEYYLRKILGVKKLHEVFMICKVKSFL
jgi:hypothetical protein